MRVMLNDVGQGKEHLVSDKQTGVSAATASQTLRGASVGAFPPSTFRSITEAAAALSQLPSFQTLAAAGIQPNVAMMQTAGLAAKLSARYEVPSIARVAVDLAPQLRGIDIMNSAGIASSLDAALAWADTARHLQPKLRRSCRRSSRLVGWSPAPAAVLQWPGCSPRWAGTAKCRRTWGHLRPTPPSRLCCAAPPVLLGGATTPTSMGCPPDLWPAVQPSPGTPATPRPACSSPKASPPPASTTMTVTNSLNN